MVAADEHGESVIEFVDQDRMVEGVGHGVVGDAVLSGACCDQRHVHLYKLACRRSLGKLACDLALRVSQTERRRAGASQLWIDALNRENLASYAASESGVHSLSACGVRVRDAPPTLEEMFDHLNLFAYAGGAQSPPMLQTRSLAGVWSMRLVVHHPCGPSLLKA